MLRFVNVNYLIIAPAKGRCDMRRLSVQSAYFSSFRRSRMGHTSPSIFIRRPIALGVSALATGILMTACGGGGGEGDPVINAMRSEPTVKEVAFVSPSPASCPTTSHPFSTMLCSLGASMDNNSTGTTPIDLKALGYTEKEFFQSGFANVYDLDADERAVVRRAGNAYTNRLLVRFPSDTSKFSGRVYVEILNASNGYDIENTWRRSWQHLIKSGDAFIGITSKSVTADALKKFDPVRYADINWKVDGANEDGLSYDMLSQLATKLRQTGAGGILGGLQPQYVYLTGESQSGMYMNTYLTAFSNKLEKAGPGGKPLFDGYLGGVGPAAMPLRTEGAAPTVSVPKKLWVATSVPYIAYMSENESRMYTGAGAGGGFPAFPPYSRRADANSASDKFRYYEFPGTPHADPLSPILPINAEIVKAGGSARAQPIYYGTQVHDDLQLTEFVHAMQENIHAWAAKGIAAPAADTRWMQYNTSIDPKGNTVYAPQRDAQGNALGGIRSPLIDVPLYRFYGQGQTGPTTYIGSSWGSMEKFSDATINSLYSGSCSTYLNRFASSSDALVAARYLVRGDADQLNALGKKLATQATSTTPVVAWSAPCL